MMTASKLGKNVEVLRQDANKMIEDLGRLQTELLQEGKEVSVTTANKITAAAQVRLAETRRQLQAVDETLHKRPYSYYALGGAFAIGLIGGLFLPANGRLH